MDLARQESWGFSEHATLFHIAGHGRACLRCGRRPCLCARSLCARSRCTATQLQDSLRDRAVSRLQWPGQPRCGRSGPCFPETRSQPRRWASGPPPPPPNNKASARQCQYSRRERRNARKTKNGQRVREEAKRGKLLLQRAAKNDAANGSHFECRLVGGLICAG